MAGHDVLAITLRAIIHHLSRNPRVQAALRAELNSVTPNADSVPYTTLNSLPYL